MNIARVNIWKAGLVVGIVLGVWHLCWSALVAAGWAQRVADFVLWMHFIRPVYVIEPFEISRAAVLIGVASAAGFVAGALGAWIWNRMHRA